MGRSDRTVFADVDLAVEKRTGAVEKETGLDGKGGTLRGTAELGARIAGVGKVGGSLVQLSAHPVHQRLPGGTVHFVDVLVEGLVGGLTVEEGRTVVLHDVEVIVRAEESRLGLVLLDLLGSEFRAAVHVLHEDTGLTDAIVHVSVLGRCKSVIRGLRLEHISAETGVREGSGRLVGNAGVERIVVAGGIGIVGDPAVDVPQILHCGVSLLPDGIRRQGVIRLTVKITVAGSQGKSGYR